MNIDQKKRGRYDHSDERVAGALLGPTNGVEAREIGKVRNQKGNQENGRMGGQGGIVQRTSIGEPRSGRGA